MTKWCRMCHFFIGPPHPPWAINTAEGWLHEELAMNATTQGLSLRVAMIDRRASQQACPLRITLSGYT